MRFTSIREVLLPHRLAVIAPDRTLGRALDVMEQHAVTALVITSARRVQGIVCARDIIRHVSQHGGLQTTQISAVMTRNVVCAETRDCLTDICQKMRAGGFDHMPVIDLTGRVVGLLHRDDIPCDQVALSARRDRPVRDAAPAFTSARIAPGSVTPPAGAAAQRPTQSSSLPDPVDLTEPAA